MSKSPFVQVISCRSLFKLLDQAESGDEILVVEVAASRPQFTFGIRIPSRPLDADFASTAYFLELLSTKRAMRMSLDDAYLNWYSAAVVECSSQAAIT